MPNAPPPPPPSSASAGSAVARLTGMPPNAADASLTLAPFATEGFRAGGTASRFAAARAATRAGRTATCVDDEGACRWSAARARRSSRACGASARARDAWRRSHWTCQSGGCTVRRLVRCGGGWGDGSRRVTSRGAPSRTARALNALVTVVMVRAFHSTLFKLWRRGRRARRAGRASANVKFQTSLFLHTCFSASVSRVESRQSPGFCAAPIGRGDSANLLSTTNPNDAQSSRQSST